MRIYELRRFKSSDDNDLTKALSLYAKNIDSLIRTDSREILYWLDNYSKRYPDKFCLLGLYLNNVLIGFSELVYFVEEKIVFVDYIVIDSNHRRNNTFYEFIENIKGFLDEECLNYDNIICEVGYYEHGKEFSGPGRNLIRLLKMSGFGVIKNDYIQPMLGKTNFESELKCVLMIFPINDLGRIKRETFMMILDTIYFKHYKRWYDAFFSEMEQASYVQRLFKIKDEIQIPLKKKEYIEINGYSHLFPVNSSKTTTKKYTQLAKFVGTIILLAAFAGILGTVHYYVKKFFQIDLEAQAYIIVASAVIVFAMMSFLFDEKKNSFYGLLEKLIDKFK